MMLLIPAVLMVVGLVSLWNLAVTALAEKIVDVLATRRSEKLALASVQAQAPTVFELAVSR